MLMLEMSKDHAVMQGFVRPKNGGDGKRLYRLYLKGEYEAVSVDEGARIQHWYRRVVRAQIDNADDTQPATEYNSQYHIIKDDRGFVLGRFGFGRGDPVLFDADTLARFTGEKPQFFAVAVKIVEAK